MATVDPLLLETIEGIFSDHCAPEQLGAAEGGIDAKLWSTLVESGLATVGVTESAGGSGGTLADAAAILKAAGRHSAPVPIAETSFLAGWACEQAGIALPAGPLAIVLSGHEQRSYWAPVAANLVVVTAAGVQVVAEDATVRNGHPATNCNYAGEPWAAVPLPSAAAAVAGPSISALYERGALARALLIAGGLSRAVDLSIQYANEREQFGRQIGKFQIIQHYLAEMAGEAAAAEAAADTAVDVLAAGAAGQEATRVVAIAKAVTGRATGIICRLAHQIHGAIGYTDEHRLQYTTRRLWSWRDEYGTEAEWAAILGRSLAASGGPALWPALTNWPPAA